jgi:hypothetical protein
MRRIAEIHLECPLACVRRLSTVLTCEGRQVGRRRMATWMKRIGDPCVVLQAQHQYAASGASGVPVSAPPFGDCPLKSGLGG